MSIKKRFKDDIDLSTGYKASGKLSSASIPIYLLYILLAVAAAELIIVLGSVLTGYITESIENQVGIYLMLMCITYFLTGFVIAGIINTGTKVGKSRSRFVVIEALLMAIVLSIVGRIAVIMTLMPLNGEGANTISGLPIEYWGELIIGFIGLTIGALRAVKLESVLYPFCEKCNDYMKEESTTYPLSYGRMILTSLKKFRSSGHTNIHWTYKPDTPLAGEFTNLLLYNCTSCGNSHIKLNLHHETLSDDKNIKQVVLNLFDGNSEIKQHVLNLFGDSLTPEAYRLLSEVIINPQEKLTDKDSGSNESTNDVAAEIKHASKDWDKLWLE